MAVFRDKLIPDSWFPETRKTIRDVQTWATISSGFGHQSVCGSFVRNLSFPYYQPFKLDSRIKNYEYEFNSISLKIIPSLPLITFFSLSETGTRKEHFNSSTINFFLRIRWFVSATNEISRRMYKLLLFKILLLTLRFKQIELLNSGNSSRFTLEGNEGNRKTVKLRKQ